MQEMTRAAEPNLADVLASARSGDDTAFARIVETYDGDMYRVCVAIARDQTIAADGVQAAWAIAWKKIGTVREPERLRPWLVSVAANETKKLLNKRARRSEVEHIDRGSVDGGSADPATGVASIDLRDALERLDPDDRALLAMRYVAGFNATELAGAIGLSPPGTRARLQRLLARLRTELD